MNSQEHPRHSNPETSPVAGSAYAPVGLFVALALLLFWGMSYLDSRAGGFQATVYAPYRSFRDVDADQPRSGPEGDLRKGQAVFKLYCTACHGENGQGNPMTRIPPLASSEWVTNAGAGRLIRIVLNSVEGPITVNSQQYDTPGMMAWGGQLTNDVELAALFSFLRQNKEWGHNASFVTPEQVTQIREQTKDRGRPWTAPELLQISDKD
jgi:mono/diheme cytochrome c family protein